MRKLIRFDKPHLLNFIGEALVFNSRYLVAKDKTEREARIIVFQRKNGTPPIKKKLTHIEYYIPVFHKKMSTIDPKFVELTADVLKIFL